MKPTDITDPDPIMLFKIPYYRRVDTYYKQWEKVFKLRYITPHLTKTEHPKCFSKID